MLDLKWQVYAVVAAAITAIATALWLLGVIPWWGIVLVVPVGTVVVAGALIVFLILAWMAGGSH